MTKLGWLFATTSTFALSVALFGIGKAYVEQSGIDDSQVKETAQKCTAALDQLSKHSSGTDPTTTRKGGYGKDPEVSPGKKRTFTWDEAQKPDELSKERNPYDVAFDSAMKNPFDLFDHTAICGQAEKARSDLQEARRLIDRNQEAYLLIAFLIFIFGSTPIATRYGWYFFLERLSELAEAIRGKR